MPLSLGSVDKTSVLPSHVFLNQPSPPPLPVLDTILEAGRSTITPAITAISSKAIERLSPHIFPEGMNFDSFMGKLNSVLQDLKISPQGTTPDALLLTKKLNTLIRAVALHFEVSDEMLAKSLFPEVPTVGQGSYEENKDLPTVIDSQLELIAQGIGLSGQSPESAPTEQLPTVEKEETKTDEPEEKVVHEEVLEKTSGKSSQSKPVESSISMAVIIAFEAHEAALAVFQAILIAQQNVRHAITHEQREIREKEQETIQKEAQEIRHRRKNELIKEEEKKYQQTKKDVQITGVGRSVAVGEEKVEIGKQDSKKRSGEPTTPVAPPSTNVVI